MLRITKNQTLGQVKKKAGFMVKTHDTASNSTYVFRTTKASDLGMVMRTLHGLGADMAGVVRSKTTEPAKGVTDEEKDVAAPAATASTAVASAVAGDEDGKTAGSKKKKKGKKR